MTRRLKGVPGAYGDPVSQGEREASVLHEELRQCRRQCREIARAIHDGPFHDMTGLVLIMAAARSGAATLEDYAARCRESQEHLDVSLGDLRRAIHRLERCGSAGGG